MKKFVEKDGTFYKTFKRSDGVTALYPVDYSEVVKSRFNAASLVVVPVLFFVLCVLCAGVKF